MIYKNPKNLFQEKLSSVINKERGNSGILEHIFKLQQIFSLERINLQVPQDPEKSSWSILLEIYTLLGKEKFAELIQIIDGNVLAFPTSEEYQDSLVTSLCYYYRELEGLTWDQIRDRLDMPKLNTFKYGIKVRAFKGFIENGTLSAIKKETK